ncbi:MAG: Tripartite ATP-independent periplasmic transporter solute receptor, DctP family [Thermotoga petrophila]|uniref:Tripartite ATP-independent periplasmic transporter solute receptor, DctP family n=1 Tax=Thermotoga petrophila TaxID=93929 RepID=A0A124FFQ6_9THEM|nr:MAG: Tripartite ATP-independent periplasmic transporter solute receptor, DctP family [Thermotoga petrophila]
MVARNYMNYTVLEQEAKLLEVFREEYGMEIIIPDKEAFIKHAQEYYLNLMTTGKNSTGRFRRCDRNYLKPAGFPSRRS